jgi:hypothetical protein
MATICSLLWSPSLEAQAARQQNGNNSVGGIIISTSNLLGPWIGVLVILALIVATVLRRGKTLRKT